MHMSREVRHSEKLLIITISGRLDFSKLGREQRLMHENDELAGYSLLMDIRAAEVEHLSHDDTTAYAEVPHAPIPPKRIAILVSNDVQRAAAQLFITMRYFQKHYSPCKIFEQLANALIWIKK